MKQNAGIALLLLIITSATSSLAATTTDANRINDDQGRLVWIAGHHEQANEKKQWSFKRAYGQSVWTMTVADLSIERQIILAGYEDHSGWVTEQIVYFSDNENEEKDDLFPWEYHRSHARLSGLVTISGTPHELTVAKTEDANLFKGRLQGHEVILTRGAITNRIQVKDTAVSFTGPGRPMGNSGGMTMPGSYEPKGVSVTVKDSPRFYFITEFAGMDESVPQKYGTSFTYDERPSFAYPTYLIEENKLRTIGQAMVFGGYAWKELDRKGIFRLERKTDKPMHSLSVLFVDADYLPFPTGKTSHAISNSPAITWNADGRMRTVEHAASSTQNKTPMQSFKRRFGESNWTALAPGLELKLNIIVSPYEGDNVYEQDEIVAISYVDPVSQKQMLIPARFQRLYANFVGSIIIGEKNFYFNIFNYWGEPNKMRGKIEYNQTAFEFELVRELPVETSPIAFESFDVAYTGYPLEARDEYLMPANLVAAYGFRVSLANANEYYFQSTFFSRIEGIREQRMTSLLYDNAKVFYHPCHLVKPETMQYPTGQGCGSFVPPGTNMTMQKLANHNGYLFTAPDNSYELIPAVLFFDRLRP